MPETFELRPSTAICSSAGRPARSRAAKSPPTCSSIRARPASTSAATPSRLSSRATSVKCPEPVKRASRSRDSAEWSSSTTTQVTSLTSKVAA
jgi:hypothetical protein